MPGAESSRGPRVSSAPYAAPLPGRDRQARPRRSRPRRQGHRPGAARRRLRGHLHRALPDARADRRDRAAGGRRRRRAVGALGRAHHAVPAGGRAAPARRASATCSCSAAGSSPTTTPTHSGPAASPRCSRPARRSRTSPTGWRRRSTTASRTRPRPGYPRPQRASACMDLFEYQGKQLFAQYGIPVSPGEAVDHRRRRGGRGRAHRLPRRGEGAGAGGRARQGRRHQARRRRRRGPRPRHRHPRHGHQGPHRARALGSRSASDIAEEYYASFTLDRSAKLHLGMLSAQGGVDIEEVAEEDPERDRPDPRRPGRRAHRGGGARVGRRGRSSTPPPPTARSTSSSSSTRCYVDADADLVEINPLILTPDGRVHALDAKVTLDDNAVLPPPTGRSTRPRRCATSASRPRTRRACSTSASTATSASSPTAPASR